MSNSIPGTLGSGPLSRYRLDKSLPPQPELRYTNDQMTVIAHNQGPMLVAAGPGTGKTAVMCAAIAARVQAGIPSSEVLVIALNHSAATEIKSRVTQLVGGGLTPTITTFHSFAYSLLQEFAEDEVPVLLKAAEQEVMLKEILQGLKDDTGLAERMQWPNDLQPALSTKALRIEVRNAIARAQSLGISADQLYLFASQNPHWQAIANLMREYLDTLDAQNQLDYNELIGRVLELTENENLQQRLQNRFKAIYVDEYQDIDPLQVRILRNLLTPSSVFVALGDSDQAVFGFRGAANSAVASFHKDFANLGVVRIQKLDQPFRASHELVKATSRVIERNANLLEVKQLGVNPREFRGTESDRTARLAALGIPELTVDHFESAEDEAQHIAEQIRNLVLAQDLDLNWSDIAVLARSGNASLPILQRALVAADVPVRVVFDDIPLAKEPVIKLLLQVLRTALDPARLKQPHIARELLTSQIVGMSAVDLRVLGRALKRANLGSGSFSEQLIADAVADLEHSVDLNDARAQYLYERVRAFHTLVQKAHGLYLNRATAAEILWSIWSNPAHDWPNQLRTRALGQGYAAAYANHALDAVRLLFKVAADLDLRFTDNRSVSGFIAELEAMEVSSTKALTAIAPNAVSLMTAHQSKGHSWKAVFVVSVDEGTWPDLSKRRSLFAADRLRADGLGEAPERYEIVSQERRLFYVACSRAAEILRVSTTSLDPDSGRIPSRYLAQLLDAPIEMKQYAEAVSERKNLQSAQFSVESLVAQLRRIAIDSSVSASLQEAAVLRLQELSELRDAAGRPLAPAANPNSWWGVKQLTENQLPLVPAEDPVYVRGSSFQDLLNCPLNWFMKQQAAADVGTSISANFGSVVHAIAAGVIDGDIEADEQVLQTTLDSVWSRIRYSAEWQSDLQKTAAVECLRSFLKWREARISNLQTIERDGNSIPAEFAETRFNQVIDIPMPDGTIEKFKLTGSIDILQIEADGKVFVADIKTSATPFTADKTKTNPQLGIYQTAVQQGVISNLPPDSKLAGADLLFVRNPKSDGTPTVRSQPALEDSWMQENIQLAITKVRSEDHTAVISDSCDYCPVKSSCPTQSTGKWVI